MRELNVLLTTNHVTYDVFSIIITFKHADHTTGLQKICSSEENAWSMQKMYRKSSAVQKVYSQCRKEQPG